MLQIDDYFNSKVEDSFWLFRLQVSPNNYKKKTFQLNRFRQDFPPISGYPPDILG